MPQRKPTTTHQPPTTAHQPTSPRSRAGLIPENAGNHGVLSALVAKGAAGFKSFMCPSGINDFPYVDAEVRGRRRRRRLLLLLLWLLLLLLPLARTSMVSMPHPMCMQAIAAALPFLKKAGLPFFVHAELVSEVPASKVGSLCTRLLPIPAVWPSASTRQAGNTALAARQPLTLLLLHSKPFHSDARCWPGENMDHKLRGTSWLPAVQTNPGSNRC